MMGECMASGGDGETEENKEEYLALIMSKNFMIQEFQGEITFKVSVLKQCWFHFGI